MQHTKSRTRQIPKYRLHKPSGLGVVRLNGKDIYLSKHGTEESQTEYRRVIAEWLASPTQAIHQHGPIGSAIVNELVLAYLRFAKNYYIKNGRPSGEVRNLKDAVKPLVLMHGHVPVVEFSPMSLKAVREEMINADLSRGVINERINRIRRVFKWGVENELVPPSVLHGLQAVSPLKRGRCQVRETSPVIPVPDELIDAVLRVAPSQIAAMIQLQRLTGMRPGEVVLMRSCDIETSEPIWVYTPMEHKTQHHGRKRIIHLGPQAQEILRPHLNKEASKFLFCPSDVASARSMARRSSRITPLTPSQRARTAKANRKRQLGERYTTMSYARAISYACDQATPHPLLTRTPYSKLSPEQQEEVTAWRKAHRWSPNRLRHNAATLLRKQFGIEAARVVLGHSSAGVTEIYAEQDLSKAAEIMAKVG